MSKASRMPSGGLGVFALAGASILLTLGAFELALRWLGYAPIYEVYSHPEIFWQKDELLGWSHTPNSGGVYVGPRPWPVEFEAPVRINSLGLRGPEITELPANGYRVMVLGDSLVAGFEVPWEETFPALMEAELNANFDFPVQVINAGVRGYGTDQSYLYYNERGRRLEPDLVIYVHGANDAADNVTLHRMRRTFSKGAFGLKPDGTLEPVGYPIPDYPLCSEILLDASYQPRRVDTQLESAICRSQTLLSDRSALFTFLSNRIQQRPDLLVFLYKLGSPDEGAEVETARIANGLPPEASRVAADVAPRSVLTAGILRTLAREIREDGVELMLLVIPSCWQGLDPRDFVSDGVTMLEVTEDLGRRDLQYEHDSHLNPRGHELLAHLLAPAVADRIRSRRAPHVPRRDAERTGSWSRSGESPPRTYARHEGERLGRATRPAELTRARERGLRPLASQPWITREASNGLGHGLDPFGIEELADPAEHLRHRASIRARNGQPRRHRLEEHVRDGFTAGREDKDLGGVILLVQPRVWNGIPIPEKPTMRIEPR